MTSTLIPLSALLVAIGVSSVDAATPVEATDVERIEWPLADSLELAWVPFVPVVWQADDEIPVVIADEEFDLAKHMELPVGSVVILPPWMLSFESPEDPRR